MYIYIYIHALIFWEWSSFYSVLLHNLNASKAHRNRHPSIINIYKYIYIYRLCILYIHIQIWLCKYDLESFVCRNILMTCYIYIEPEYNSLLKATSQFVHMQFNLLPTRPLHRRIKYIDCARGETPPLLGWQQTEFSVRCQLKALGKNLSASVRYVAIR